MASWPNAQEYTASVSNPKLNFLDPEIKLATPELTNLGIPRPRAGTYAIVYHLQGPQSDFAIRCFLKDFADQQERYAAISQMLKASGLPFTVTFDFLSQGIQVNRKWYPVLKMAWVKGEQLNRYIENNLRYPNKLIALANQLKGIIDAMQQREIAHCDLQNGNILVSNDRLFLIDYDGMYVPQLSGRGSHEQGHPNFQHPQRSAQNFGPTIDNFSAWVIYFSLIALSLDPTLWPASGAKDNPDQLLFDRKDFNQPHNSSTLRLLANHSNPTIQGLGILFQSMLFYDVDKVPSLDQDPTSTQSNIIIPTKQQPTWLKDYAKQTASTTPNSSAPNSSAPANAPTSSTMAASSWIIDSLAASKNVVPRNFVAPLIIPRITVFTSATAIVIALMVVFIVPTYLFPILAGATLLMAVNIMILTITFDKDPAIREARIINAEIQQQNLELAAIVKIRAEAVKQKEDLNNQFAESINDLKQEQTDLKAAEQKEIDEINTQLQTILTGLKQQQADLKAAEPREIDGINTQLQTILTGLNKQQTELKASEQREIDQFNKVLTVLNQQQMSLNAAERGEIDQINTQLQTILTGLNKQQAAERGEIDQINTQLQTILTGLNKQQAAERGEIDQINNQLQTILTGLNKQQTELKASEQREIDQFNKVLTVLNQQQMSLNAAGRGEIDQINTQLQTILTGLSKQQAAEQAEIDQINTQLQTILTGLNKQQTELKASEQTELFQTNKLLTGLKQQPADLKVSEQREIDQISNILLTILSDASAKTQKFHQAENSEMKDLQNLADLKITLIDAELRSISNKETAEIKSALSTIGCF